MPSWKTLSTRNFSLNGPAKLLSVPPSSSSSQLYCYCHQHWHLSVSTAAEKRSRRRDCSYLERIGKTAVVAQRSFRRVRRLYLAAVILHNLRVRACVPRAVNRVNFFRARNKFGRTSLWHHERVVPWGRVCRVWWGGKKKIKIRIIMIIMI